MALPVQMILNYTFLYICVFIELFSLCYLFYAISRRNSPLRQAYFVIYLLGYIVDFTTKFSAVISFYGKFKNVCLWHNQFLFGISGLVLALNRYTAIAYWNEHHRFWSFLPTCAWCIFLLLYPIIVDIGFIASDPNGFTCLPDPALNEECEKVYGRIGVRQCISNVITSIGSITLSAMTILKIRQTSAPQIARKLFIQSCVSNVIFAVFTISLVFHGYMWIHKDTTNPTLLKVVNIIANSSNYARQCVNIVWLVVITRSLIRAGNKITMLSVTGTCSTTSNRGKTANIRTTFNKG
uniref:G_PROTEIN_RECEP_F1_2 domain-containing protein n=1 Tax=Panagrellus redivivus TaxID=6233 RepID=A0A7E4UVW5_PANRE